MVAIVMNRIDSDFGFEALDSNGHKVTTDTSDEDGGHNAGMRPMQLLLASLGGCSAIDVLSILNKQRQKVEKFSMTIQGEREVFMVPALWKHIFIHFNLTGDIEKEKAQKACKLSIEKYCSVAETLRRAGATITWDIEITNP